MSFFLNSRLFNYHSVTLRAQTLQNDDDDDDSNNNNNNNNNNNSKKNNKNEIKI